MIAPTGNCAHCGARSWAFIGTAELCRLCWFKAIQRWIAFLEEPPRPPVERSERMWAALEWWRGMQYPAPLPGPIPRKVRDDA